MSSTLEKIQRQIAENPPGLDLETTLETYRLLFTDNPTVIEPYPCFRKKIGKSHYLS